MARARMTREEYRNGGWAQSVRRGEQAPGAKLTESQVREIRKNHHGKTRKQLGQQFGVHENSIEDICQWRTWRHVR